MAPELATITFSRAADYSVLGCVNEFVHQARDTLSVNDMSPAELSRNNGDVPMRGPKYQYPVREHQRLCGWRLV